MLLDSDLTMKQHFSRIINRPSCLFHLRRLQRLKQTCYFRRHEAAGCSCDSHEIRLLQLSACRQSASPGHYGSTCPGHFSRAVVELRWLPICYHIQFNLAHHQRQSPCLAGQLRFISSSTLFHWTPLTVLYHARASSLHSVTFSPSSRDRLITLRF